ncbi:oxidoreductase [Nemania sp. FL0031]|nr:oxidoreductase [Nemania sp. FL0031]
MRGKKTVLVTSCPLEGRQVIATARNTPKIGHELSGHSNVTILELDVTSRVSVQAAAEKTAERGVDVIVNNAVGDYPMPILDIDIHKAKAPYDTNVWGPVRMIQGFSNHLIKSRGRVVGMNRSASILNVLWRRPYLSSKCALKKISDVLRIELTLFGVSVVTVMTGIQGVYQNIEAELAGKSMPGTPSLLEEFAKSVMNDIVGDDVESVVWRDTFADSLRNLLRLLIEQIVGKPTVAPRI